MGSKRLQRKGRVVGGPAAGERLDLAGLADREQGGRLAGVDLVGGKHVQGRQWMDLVVPGVEAGEVGYRRRDVAEVARVE